MSTCEGLSATGPCERTAKYLVRRGSRNYAVNVGACGLHLAQQVKRQLRGTNVVEVESMDEDG